MRITGHVDYSGCKKPEPKPEPTVAPGRQRVHRQRTSDINTARAAGRPIADIPAPNAMLAWLEDICRANKRAPQLHEILANWGSHGDNVLRSLVNAGRITLEVGALNWRVIRIVGTELHTKLRDSWRPYRRVDHQGTWWRSADGKRWEQRQ